MEGKIMTTSFTGDFSDDKVTIQLGDKGQIICYMEKPEIVNDESAFFIIKDQELIGMSLGSVDNFDRATRYLEIRMPENIIPTDFFYFLTKEMDQFGYNLAVDYKLKISQASLKVYQTYWDQISPLLAAFGLRFVAPKKSRQKPRHKFLKSLAEVPFKVDYQGSHATVYWVKNNEFVVKAGAKLNEKVPLTKAGLISFAGKFGLRLRQEHEKQLKNDVLLEDITLRSVNEVGTFLYFAGTNSWLQLKAPDGKTLHELTVVK